MEAFCRHEPAPMLPLMDRPFLQHVVEFLITQKIDEFDFILSHMPEKVEQHFGDGTRWGTKFRYHLVRDPSCAEEYIKGIRGGKGEAPLVFHADHLPLTELQGLTRPEVELPEVKKELNVQSYRNFLDSHKLILDKKFPGLFLTGREIEPGIWLSRNVSLHPTARLIPPVYIGENCRIGTGAQVGPYVVIGKDCIIDARCHISESVVFPGSYVGEALELTEVIIDRNRLINARLGAGVVVQDDFIISSIYKNPLKKWILRWISRLTAILLLTITTPLLLLTTLALKLFRKGPVTCCKEVIRLPSSSREEDWKTFPIEVLNPAVLRQERLGEGWKDFLFRFLPLLANVAKGKMSFVGVRPRSREEVRGLSNDWRELYLKSKLGIISEACVAYGEKPTRDELYAAESFYSVNAGFRYDLKLMLAYLRGVVTNFSAKEIHPEEHEK